MTKPGWLWRDLTVANCFHPESRRLVTVAMRQRVSKTRADRGSPYAGAAYRTALASHGIIVSISRKGDWWDNAVAASFVATLRAELVEHERYSHHDAAAFSTGVYIYSFYNIERHLLRLPRAAEASSAAGGGAQSRARRQRVGSV
jgi:transposase InsO family protein